MNQASSGTRIAAAVGALLFAVGCGSEDPKEEVSMTTDAVRCQGINECAGLSECASADDPNACQGQNECAGQGWITVDSEQKCLAEGGMVLKA